MKTHDTRDSKSSPADSTIEREIEALLDVTPSSHFRARVRAGITDAPPPSLWTLHRVVAGSGVVAIVIALSFIANRPRETALPIVSVTPSSALANIDLQPPMKTPNAIPHFPSTMRSKEPEVLFSADETAALERLLVVMSATSVDLSPAIAIEPQHLPEFHATPIADLVPIVIEPFALNNSDRGVLQ